MYDGMGTNKIVHSVLWNKMASVSSHLRQKTSLRKDGESIEKLKGVDLLL